MTAKGVTSLGYLGVTAPDVDAWRPFAEEVLGAEVVPPAPGEEGIALRIDERAWRIAVAPGEGGLAYVGWEVPGADALDRIGRDLAAAGCAVEDDAKRAAIREVAALLHTKDPAGNVLEFFYGARVPRRPFVSGRGVRFVTGELGLGHVVLGRPDTDDLVHFYRDVLGFRVSDTVAIGPISLVFFHVNPRHHSLALAAIPGAPAGLGHFMLEVDDLDDVGRALDAVEAGAAPLTRTLGRHSNDHMVSFYVRSPSGFDVEYGWNGRAVDDATWTVSSYDAPSVWGHRSVRASDG